MLGFHLVYSGTQLLLFLFVLLDVPFELRWVEGGFFDTFVLLMCDLELNLQFLHFLIELDELWVTCEFLGDVDGHHELGEVGSLFQRFQVLE